MDLTLRTPEADVASGVIRITINGTERVMPTLKIGPFEDEWLPSQKDTVKQLFEANREPADLFTLGMSTLLDAIVAYDRTGALGGRDWLRQNADHNDLHKLVRMIWQRHFEGFMKDVQAVMGSVRQMNQAAAATEMLQQLQAKSTNGPSPTGEDSPPTGSVSH